MHAPPGTRCWPSAMATSRTNQRSSPRSAHPPCWREITARWTMPLTCCISRTAHPSRRPYLTMDTAGWLWVAAGVELSLAYHPLPRISACCSPCRKGFPIPLQHVAAPGARLIA
eukprot:1156911-Pelagomonas_calceolata.AAC.4